jgi:hypothetical protein
LRARAQVIDDHLASESALRTVDKRRKKKKVLHKRQEPSVAAATVGRIGPQRETRGRPIEVELDGRR